MNPVKRGDYFLLPESPGCRDRKSRLVQAIDQHKAPELDQYWYVMRGAATWCELVNISRCCRVSPAHVKRIMKGRGKK